MTGLFSHIVKRSLRVPAPAGRPGNGEVITRQLDVALMSVGFKLSQEALRHFSVLHPAILKDLAANVLSAVRELVGDHCQHNTYFKEFPANVPDTMEFWLQCITKALFDPNRRQAVTAQVSFGVVNLLELPTYGEYQHSYEEMLEAHEQFIPSAKDLLKILNLGKSLPEEALELYHSLAESPVPLNESDRELLAHLTEVCLHDPQPNSIPVRENLALINSVRVSNGRAPIIDTPTDVLRLACALSGGDVSLGEVTKFKSLPRKVRLLLMVALNSVIESQPAKLADVNQYRGQWKRLGERLHPHEYRRLKHAQNAFAVARGEKRAQSLAGKIEMALAARDAQEAIRLLATAPGMLLRYLDRLLRTDSGQQAATLLEIIPMIISKVSGRVILSVREHLQNRLEGETAREPTSRIFANSKGKAWVEPDRRRPLPENLVRKILEIFDGEVLRRLPEIERLVVNSEVLGMAIPLSDKHRSEGFGVMPRGSVLPVAKGTIRFFVYWKERAERTDYDLSALMLDGKFEEVDQISWTNLRSGNDIAIHSGDITSAAAGASEFIDIDLNAVDCSYIIPQINVFTGERFDEAHECFMGFMERRPEQKGKPFEAATVRMKSVIRGKGKVALPLVFIRNEDGGWSAKWMNIFLNGLPQCNRVEANRMSTALLARSIVRRRYLDLTYLAMLLMAKAKNASWYTGQEMTEPVTYVGIDAPDSLPKGSVNVTLSNLQELIPE